MKCHHSHTKEAHERRELCIMVHLCVAFSCYKLNINTSSLCNATLEASTTPIRFVKKTFETFVYLYIINRQLGVNEEMRYT